MGLNIAQAVMAGNVASAPQRRAGTFELVTFRMAADRRWHDGNGWQQADTVYVEVQCWGQLGRNVLTSVGKGMPFIVVGRLMMSQWEETLPDGTVRNRSAIRIKASHCGPDLNRLEVRTARAQRQDAEDYGMTDEERREEARLVAAHAAGALAEGAEGAGGVPEPGESGGAADGSGDAVPGDGPRPPF